jgi:hypothetical protein
MAFVTGFSVFTGLFAINGFSQDARTSGFTHSAGTAK